MDEELLPVELAESATGFPTEAIWIAVGIVVAVLLLAVVVSAIKKAFSRPEMVGLSREEIRKRFAQARQMAAQGHMGQKLAILEADALLDAALKSLMLPGDTLGERLKTAAYRYPKISEVWPAHKLRNQLAHEPSFQFSVREGNRALDDFERALKHLGVM